MPVTPALRIKFKVSLSDKVGSCVKKKKKSRGKGKKEKREEKGREEKGNREKQRKKQMQIDGYRPARKISKELWLIC